MIPPGGKIFAELIVYWKECSEQSALLFSDSDKAFALSGKRTHPYMSCAELSHPRIKKTEIKNIILGQGEKLLSPERRFDAILVNSPELFT